MIKPNKYNQFPAEFDDVYGAIACVIRNTGRVGTPQKRGLTKSFVAAVHRKMLAGETLDEGWEQEIARRLRQQLTAAGQGTTGQDKADQ